MKPVILTFLKWRCGLVVNLVKALVTFQIGVAFVVILGYVSNKPDLCRWFSLPVPMALNTAVVFFVGGLGVFLLAELFERDVLNDGREKRA